MRAAGTNFFYILALIVREKFYNVYSVYARRMREFVLQLHIIRVSWPIINIRRRRKCFQEKAKTFKNIEYSPIFWMELGG